MFGVSVPAIKLNNGFEMPAFGLGTCQQVAAGGERQFLQIVKNAIDVGYRLIDCSQVSGFEKIIGQAIQAIIKERKMKREDFFIVGKLWCTGHHPDSVEKALKCSLKEMQLTYFDLYLMHWPMAFREGCELFPRDSETGSLQFADVDYAATWRAMETVYRKQLTHSIGVSNFNYDQLCRILNGCSVTPQVLQVECHPYLNQKELRQLCEQNAITLMAYNTVGSDHPSCENPVGVKEDPRILQLAKQYKRTAAQILIKYSLQLGNAVTVSTMKQERLVQNISVFDFQLAPEDMSLINTFNCNRRMSRFIETRTHKDYPFDITIGPVGSYCRVK